MTSRPLKLVRQPEVRYPDVGLCIYCGTTKELEDEHIVPFGLGGNAVLPMASCRSCAGVTSRFERTVLRGPLRPIRVALGIQSRRKHRGAPTVLPLRVKRGDKWATLHLPYAEYPLVLEFFVFDTPGYVDPSYSKGVRVRGHQTFIFGLRPEEVKARLGVEQISAPRQYAPTDFAKMTAKVGYAMAIAIGAIVPGRGRPEVVRSILGKVDEIGRWVGTIADPRVINPDLVHEVTVHREEQNGFLFARVQYLTSVGSPIYGVILGELNEAFVKANYAPQSPYQVARDCRWASHAAPVDSADATANHPTSSALGAVANHSYACLSDGMDDEVLVKDLPPDLIESVLYEISAYTVAFVRVKDMGGRRFCTLLGSGVLVAAAGTKAILTAHHVIQVLPKTGRLCVMLEKTSEPHTLNTKGLAFLSIARGTNDADGPDLGAVVLAPHLAGSIAAKKVFFNLDRKRDEMLSDSPDVRDGVWFAQGFLEERMVATEDPDGGTTTNFYNFSGVGGPDGPVERGGYDYYEYPVTHESRLEAPVSWGGMSGGGVWRIPLARIIHKF